MESTILQIAACGLVLTPLAGATYTAFTQSSGKRRAPVATTAALTWLASAVLLGLTCGAGTTANWDIIAWMAFGHEAVITIGILLDPTAAITAFVIASTNLAVNVYRIAVEKEAPSSRHQDAVVLFGVFSALLAVIANNYGMLFVGWEGVALSAWMLMRLRGDAASAARTLVFQGIASLALLSAMVFMLLQSASVAFADVLGDSASAEIIGLSIAAAAVARAGMWPLHPWLERSASLGTPAAAFIQTVFAAPLGIYLLVRSWPLLHGGDGLSAGTPALVLTGLGLAGATLMAACAMATRDPRRSLAYSTSSQGAIALSAASMGMPAVALLQLAIHTSGKCVLLLTTGLVERACPSSLDLATLGGLRLHLKSAFWFFLVATILLACPPFASFWVQLSILHSASSFNIAFLVLGCLTVLLTSAHLFRLLFGIFLGANPNTVMRKGSTSIPGTTSVTLFGLVVIGLAVSHQASPIRLAAALPRVFTDLGALPALALLESKLGLACVLLAIAGCGWAWLAARHATEPAGRRRHPLRHLLAHGLLFDDLYTVAIARPLRWLANRLWTIVDVALIELLCIRGIGVGVRAGGWLLGILHDGRFASAATAIALTTAVTLVAVLWLTSP